MCNWKCKVNRLEGEKGVCRARIPEIAYTSLASVLKSYSVTLLGCSFKCIYCNAYRISQYPDSGWIYRGYERPDDLVQEALEAFETLLARKIDIKKLSFTGGESSIHTPYIEEVVSIMKEKMPELEVGLATNGFSTFKTMKRLAKISSYINFEIKAFDYEIHHAITGAPAKPVLKNAEWLARKHPEKIRVFRTVVIPGINDSQISKIAQFILEIDPDLPYRLVGYRPHFILYYHHLAPSRSFMQELVESCKKLGLKRVDYSGYYPSENIHEDKEGMKMVYNYLDSVGCYRRPRNCGLCPEKDHCPAIVLEPWTNLPKE
ncbi:MAG: radical SAM protein [Methanobacteriaceae archaeon]